MASQDKEVLSFYVPVDIAEQIKSNAAAEGRSISQYLTMLVSRALSDHAVESPMIDAVRQAVRDELRSELYQ